MTNNTDNDDKLFRKAMLDVKTYEHKGTDPYRQKRPAKPLPLNEQQDNGEDLADLASDAPEFFDFRRPGIQHRVYHDLQRGLMPPEDSLDLHGMRVTDARQAFARFMRASLQRQLRCIRIIHGKGRGSADQQPVLKQKTYHWLLQTDAVLAFVSTPRWDGGSGACYALLSRKAHTG